MSSISSRRIRSRRRWLRFRAPRPIATPGKSTIKAAEAYNKPNQFTAFIGFEWTSNTGGNNLHRVVVMRDGGDKARQVEPYTTIRPVGSDDPKDLWKYLQAYEDKTGGEVLAIAHNGNLSNGIMFPEIDSFTGKPLTKEYVETRARWEPLYEATQIKGDGEAHRYLSPTDELAGYEIWDKFNLNMSVPKEKPMLQYEYARTALQIGLQLEAKLGTNPYKFGMVGRPTRTQVSPLPTRTTSSASTAAPSRIPSGWLTRSAASATTASLAGNRRRPDTPRSGRPRTRANRSLRRWNARKHTRPPARG